MVSGMDPPGGVEGGGVSTPQLGSRPKLGGGCWGVEIFTKLFKKTKVIQEKSFACSEQLATNSMIYMMYLANTVGSLKF